MMQVPQYKDIAGKMRNFTRILDLLVESETAASCMLPKTGFIALVDEVEQVLRAAQSSRCALLGSLPN